MQLEQAIAELQSILSYLHEDLATVREIMFSSVFITKPHNAGQFFFLFHNPKGMNTNIPEKPVEQTLNEVQSILERYIENTTFLLPTEPSFPIILNHFLSNSKPFLIEKDRVIEILNQTIQDLRTNRWQKKAGKFFSSDPDNPKLIIHTLRRNENYAAVFQIHELRRLGGYYPNLPDEVVGGKATISSQPDQIQNQTGNIPSSIINTGLRVQFNHPEINEGSGFSYENKTIEQLYAELVELREEREELLNIGTEKETEIQMLKSQLDLSGFSYDEQINVYQGKIREQQREIAQMKEEINQLKAKVFDAQEQVRNVNDEKQNIEKTYEELKQLQTDKGNLEAQQAELTKIIEEYKKKTQELQDQLNKVRAEQVSQYQSHVNEIADWKKKIDTLEEANGIKIIHLRDELNEAKATIAQLNQEKTHLTEMNSELKKELTQKNVVSQEELSQLQLQNAQLREENERIKQETEEKIRNIRAKIKDLSGDVNT
jgi:hypothetical protein